MLGFGVKDNEHEYITRVEFEEFASRNVDTLKDIKSNIERLVSMKQQQLRDQAEAGYEANRQQQNQEQHPQVSERQERQQQQHRGIVDNILGSLGSVIGALGIGVAASVSAFLTWVTGGAFAPQAQAQEVRPRSGNPTRVPSSSGPQRPARAPYVPPRRADGSVPGGLNDFGGDEFTQPDSTLGYANGSSGGGNTSSLSRLIARGESRGDYNVYNYNGGHDIGHADLASMTVQQIREAQASGRMFAVGKYQIIPSTLNDAIGALHINPDEHFTPELQERIFNQYLLRRHSALRAYLDGRSNDVDAAANDAAKEWASLGVAPGSPTRNGGRGSANGLTSYYDGNGVDHASVSHDEVVQALQQDRNSRPTNSVADNTPSPNLRPASFTQTDEQPRLTMIDASSTQTNNRTVDAPQQQKQIVPRSLPLSPRNGAVMQHAGLAASATASHGDFSDGDSYFVLA